MHTATGTSHQAGATGLDLGPARSALTQARRAAKPRDRFLGAHLAALRVAAVLMVLRARPNRRSRPRDTWALVGEVAPEYAEWAAFFGLTARRREAVREGRATVSVREADDLIRDAETFLALVERSMPYRASPVPDGG